MEQVMTSETNFALSFADRPTMKNEIIQNIFKKRIQNFSNNVNQEF